MSLATYTSKTWTDYADSPCLEAVELNRIDSGIAAVTAELLALEAALPTTYQPISAELSALAALSSTGYAKRSGAAAWSVVSSIPQADVASVSGWITTALAGKAASTHTHAQSDVTGLTAALSGLQPLDADLTAIAALSTQAYGRSLLTAADAAAARALLGAQAAGSYQPLDGDLTAISALSSMGFVRRTAADTWAASALAWSDIASGHPSVTAGTGLTGGGSLTGSVTLSVSYGTAAGTAAQGNDSRILNGQTAYGWGNHALAGYRSNLAPAYGSWWQGTPSVAGDGVTELGKYLDFHATSAGTSDFDIRLTAGVGTLDVGGSLTCNSVAVILSNDSRLSDSRTPTAHALDGALHTISGKTAGQVLLATAATTFGFVTISGDATLSGTGALTLASTITAGSAGGAASVPVLTWDSKGRLTAASTAAITPASIGAAAAAHAHSEITVSRIATDCYNADDSVNWVTRASRRGNHFGRAHGFGTTPSYYNYVMLREASSTKYAVIGNAIDSEWYVGQAAMGNEVSVFRRLWHSENLTGDQTAHSHSYDRDRANHTGVQAQSTIVSTSGWISDALNGRVLANAWNNQAIAIAESAAAYFSDSAVGDLCVRAPMTVSAVRFGVYPGGGNPASMFWYNASQVGFAVRPTFNGVVPWDYGNLVGTRNEHNHAGLYQVKENQSLSSNNSVQFVGLTLMGDLAVSTYSFVGGSDTVPAGIPTLGYSYNKVTPNTINDSATYCVVKLPVPVYGKSVVVYSLPGKAVVIRSASGTSIIYNSSGALTGSEALSGMGGSGRLNGGCGFFSDGTYWYCVFNSTNA